MIDQILNALQELKIAEYRINEETVESAELFFIKKKLDMRRAKDVHRFSVTVYRPFSSDGKDFKGMYCAVLYPDMTPEEIRGILNDAYFAAGFVKNPTFCLPAGTRRVPVAMPSRMSGMSLSDAAWELAKALFLPDTRSDAFLNSAELFLTRSHVRILNSAGIDVSYISHLASGEFVVQAREPQDVELYQDFSYRDLDTAALTDLVARALDTVCARAKAVRAPQAGSYRVILSDKHVVTLLQNYLTKANAGNVYAGWSQYACGKPVQGEQVQGERLNITMVADVPFDEEGLEKIDRVMLQDGVLTSMHGASRFCEYLHMPPVGNYRCIRVDNGTVPLSELEREPYLYVVSFSDFQMDAFSGHFGGEIRLAYLFDGQTVTPVTGGSINGSLLERQGDLLFSTERYRDRTYDGPFAVCIRDVNVAGA